MSKRNGKITITIDNKAFKVDEGLTILEAAKQNDVYIPTLCYHDELTPYGGCRMCIVEVDGFRNLPTACTTPVQDGMVVRTQTSLVQSTRKEILQLFLSEHPASCLACGEQEECKLYSDTIRKAGMTTGCRFCSKDGQCELQDVTEYLGIEELEYPIHYRGLPLENGDPFYDRNFNLCILCGRCVRECQEVRLANVLAFINRGRETVIGPAFGRSYLDAGCEFCGACVSVCPTGAISEKAKKWEGVADREEITTCSYCGVGCQMRLLIKGDRVIGSLPAEDDLVNNGQLCVKGRFCIPELVNSYQRSKRPFKTFRDIQAEITWDEAVDMAAEKLADCSPDEFGMLISSNCTNENLYLAQKFARVVMGSHNIDCSARLFYGAGFNAYLKLLKRAAPLTAIHDASVILCIGLDTRFARSVVGVGLRKAIRRGAKIITINPRDHNITVVADKWIRPVPGTGVDLLKSLLTLVGKKKTSSKAQLTGALAGFNEDVAAVAEMLNSAKKPVILVGSEFMQYDRISEILEVVDQLADNAGAEVLPLPAQNNLFGSLLMGSYPEVLPGGFASKSRTRLGELKKKWDVNIPADSSGWNAESLLDGKKLKVLYLVGEIPGQKRPPADFIISQNIFSPGAAYRADLILPAAAFTEEDGTYINGEGRLQRNTKAVEPPHDALADWQILCKIARKMGKKGFDYKSVSSIFKEISELVDGFDSFKKPKRNARPLAFEADMKVNDVKTTKTKPTGKSLPFVLSVSHSEHTYRGFPLSDWVDGSKSVFVEETLDINPEDARKAGIINGDKVEVSAIGVKKTWPARLLKEQARGTLHVNLPLGELIRPNPLPVKIRKCDV